MRKKIINLFLLLVVVSCATKPVVETPIKPTDLIPEVIIPPTLVSDVFDYQSNLLWVKKLSESANCVIKKDSFASRVYSVVSFDYSTSNGEKVYNDLINHKCTIRTYKTRNPFSSVIATTYLNNKKDLYLNTRSNPRIFPSMINTAIHECLHNAGYSHGDNTPTGKENSVNYKVGKIAELESEGCY